MSPASTGRLALEVSDVQAEARDVILVELRRPGGGDLPAFDPGAHLELQLPNGLIRHYSLTNDWRERDRYVIGVGRASASRGGSLYVHQSLRRGMTLPSSEPRNNFKLDPRADSYLFIAGGIGITPIVAMVRWCEAQGRPWRLVYAVRSAQRTAFGELLRAFGDRVRLHCDDEPGNVLDLSRTLDDVPPGQKVYCCGPQPMMAAVKAQGKQLAPGQLVFEYFTAPQDEPAAPPAADDGFLVKLRRSGKTLAVPADRSILEVLEGSGMSLPFSCREGLCRACETVVCEGEVEHRDFVLSQEEREAGCSMLICVSRAKSPRLVLDL